ncbi:hypothetical protein RB197_00015, partial [Streptomyces umbrinus]
MPKYSDDEYAAILNAREAGDLPNKDEMGGNLVSYLRGAGRREELKPILKMAFRRHGLEPEKGDDGRWRIPKVDGRIRWTDSQYAQALNSLEVGTPLGQRNLKGKGVRDGVEVDVPVGTFVSRLLDTSGTNRVH